MRLDDFLRHPKAHTALVDVGIDDHHDQPEVIEESNTVLSVEPLPGGPGVWDIAVPLEASVVLFAFRAAKATGPASVGHAGCAGCATRNSYEAASVSIADWSQFPIHQVQAFYAKRASALNLSHKVFTSSGQYVSLSDAYLTLTGPSTRVFRTLWTNYGASYYTLTAYGLVGVVG